MSMLTAIIASVLTLIGTARYSIKQTVVKASMQTVMQQIAKLPKADQEMIKAQICASPSSSLSPPKQ